MIFRRYGSISLVSVPRCYATERRTAASLTTTLMMRGALPRPNSFSKTGNLWRHSHVLIASQRVLHSVAMPQVFHRNVVRTGRYSTQSSSIIKATVLDNPEPESTPQEYYQQLVDKRQIEFDPSQLQALHHLQGSSHAHSKQRFYTFLMSADGFKSRDDAAAALAAQTLNNLPQRVSPASSLGWIMSWFSASEENTNVGENGVGDESDQASGNPQGVYMYGDVGCGKTFLLDLFYRCVAAKRKRRVHFNQISLRALQLTWGDSQFMIDVHTRIHRWREAKKQHTNAHEEDDPLVALSRHYAGEAWLLCFDEFQVTNVADAMILNRLFRLMLQDGVVVVSTSNRRPEDLYENGLQRDRFIPFIQMLRRRFIVHPLASGKDYRFYGSAGSPMYYTPLSSAASVAVQQRFVELTHGEQCVTADINVTPTRRMHIGRQARGVCRFSFKELCGAANAAAEYIALCKNFHTVILENVPQMRMKDVNEARRFILLIDEIYNRKVKLICTAEVQPPDLFRPEEVVEGPPDAFFDEKTGQPLGPLWNGEEEKFAFDRALSRLAEMQTTEYLQQPHRTDV